VPTVRVLLTESASLTCRETLTVLGRAGMAADVVSSGRWTIGQFSRWRGRGVRLPAPAADPVGYLRALGEVGGCYDAVLPTHEQAWLIAAGRHLLPPRFPVAVASVESFDRVQSKIAFARLLDELGLPQPRWWLPDQPPADAPGQVWVKAAFGTAGRGVRHVGTAQEAGRLAAQLAAAGSPAMCQENAPGQYGQAQAVFDHGRMVAVHTAVTVGPGVGGSAAARLSVDHRLARDAVERIGAALTWHGGLTIDYLHQEGRPQIIECNPRMVEPANAAAAGVNLPRLLIDLTAGRLPQGRCLIGRPGVRTHSSLALALGAAAGTGSRRAVLRALRVDGGPTSPAEVLTPLRFDPPSGVPLAVAVARALARPSRTDHLAGDAVGRYAITPANVATVRAAAR
jgi:hypothetical protein